MSFTSKSAYTPVASSSDEEIRQQQQQQGAENHQFAQGFTVGSHQVKVVVDDHTAYSGEGSRVIDSRRPINLAFCPRCTMNNVRTRTKTYPSGTTWVCVAAGVVFCFPLCWLPLVIDSTKQTDHYCQSCGQKVGTIKALEGCCVKEES